MRYLVLVFLPSFTLVTHLRRTHHRSTTYRPSLSLFPAPLGRVNIRIQVALVLVVFLLIQHVLEPYLGVGVTQFVFVRFGH